MSTLDEFCVSDSGAVLATADAASPSGLRLSFRFRRNLQNRVTVTIVPTLTVPNITQAGARFWNFASIIPIWARGGAPSSYGILTGPAMDLLVTGVGTARMIMGFDQVNGHISLTPNGADVLNTPNSTVDIPAGWIGVSVSLPATYSFSFDSIY